MNVKNVNKHFPESKETQFGHMRGQRQGVRTTQPAPEPDAVTPAKPEPKQHDFLVKIYNV